MARTTLPCGSTDGRSSTWLVQSSLRMRRVTLGEYHTIYFRSHNEQPKAFFCIEAGYPSRYSSKLAPFLVDSRDRQATDLFPLLYDRCVVCG